MNTNKTFLNIAFINKIDIANLNSGEGGGGNITPLKKIQTFDGKDYVYVSGQALRRYIKETMLQLGGSITGVDEKGEPFMQGVIEKGKVTSMEFLYKKCADLDLFGYMLTNKGQGSSRRWSPVKVSPLISLLPYKDEKDFLTRKQAKEDNSSSGNIVQTEIDTFNYMKGTVMMDTDVIGKDMNEFTYLENKNYLTLEEKDNRINLFLDAIKNLNGGSKQARLLQDIAPKFVIAIKQKTANPFLLTTFKMENGVLDVEDIKSVIKDNLSIIDEVFIGLTDENLFTNSQDIKSLGDIEKCSFMTVSKAIDSLKN